ncbi:MAG: 30S ribosomal protein S2 [Gammaproteobacteria bacterium]|nr:30S ribosomal protein S2 [Gammaproteobacteria bacterium]
MKLPEVKMQDLFNASIHMGHGEKRYFPLMSSYIYGTHNKVHILDLRKTLPLMQEAMKFVAKLVSQRKRLLFVATKPSAAEIAAEAATRCGQYYMNSRWIGGLLTNWSSVHKSISNLNNMKKEMDAENSWMTKKELLKISKKYENTNRYLGGISNMAHAPDAIFVIDVKKEAVAVREANILGIPVIGVVDSDSDPRNINYIIPGNDDSPRAIQLYCRLIADAAISGIKSDGN